MTKTIIINGLYQLLADFGEGQSKENNVRKYHSKECISEKHSFQTTTRIAIKYLRGILSAKTSLISNLEKYRSVCNFQFMKSPVGLNSLFLKYFCYITWFDET